MKAARSLPVHLLLLLYILISDSYQIAAAGSLVIEAADRFTQGGPQQDDMTLLALKINAV